MIESGTRQAAKIKSHHNVGGLPEKMGFELVEPLRQLFKDEVRAVGEELGLPERIVWRQPFPGPGLGIRIIGEVTARARRHPAARRRDRAGRDQERRPVPRALAVLRHPARDPLASACRATSAPTPTRSPSAPSRSDDAMTADWARLPYELLEKVSSRIINEVPEVNRVVYDVSSKPPSTIEWE